MSYGELTYGEGAYGETATTSSEPAAPWADAVVATAPDHWWKLNEASTADPVLDSVGGKNGSYMNPSYSTVGRPSLIPGDDGTSGSHTATPINVTGLTYMNRSITRAMTFKNGTGTSIQLMYGDASNYVQFGSTSQAQINGLSFGLGYDATAPGGVLDGGAHFVVWVTQPTTTQVWVDGVKVADVAHTHNHDVTMNVLTPVQGHTFGTTVEVDDVVLWKRVLTDAEIDNLSAGWGVGGGTPAQDTPLGQVSEAQGAQPLTVSQAAPISAYVSEVLADAPLAYWRQGEASGTTMVDSSGAGRDGTYSGVSLAQPSLLATDADTATTYSSTASASVSYASWMDLTQFTFEAWVDLTTLSGIQNVGARRNSVGNPGDNVWQFRIDNGKPNLILWYSSSGLHNLVATNALTLGRHHLVLAVTATEAIVYDNGSEFARFTYAALTPYVAGHPLFIGRWGNGYEGLNNATVDEVALYGTALSSQRVLAHYDTGMGVISGTTVDLGQASEADAPAALTVTQGAPPAQEISLGQSLEGETASSLTVASTRMVELGSATEGETAGPLELRTVTTIPVETVHASELAQGIGANSPIATQELPLGVATELSDASVLTVAQTGPPAAVIGLQQVTEHQVVGEIAPPDTGQYVVMGTAMASEGVRGASVGTASPPSYAQRVIAEDAPIAYWPLNESSGTTATDVIGSRHGTHVAGSGGTMGPTAGIVPAAPGGALGGLGGFRLTPEQSGGLTSFSTEVWYRHDAHRYAMLMNRYGSNAVWYFWSDSSGYMSMAVYDLYGNTNSTSISGRLEVGQTYHLAFTWDASTRTARAYVNGVLSGTTTLINPLRTDGAGLGFGIEEASSYPSAGAFDEAALYNYALSAEQIQAHHAYGRTFVAPPMMQAAVESDEAQGVLFRRDLPIQGRLVIEPAFERDEVPITGLHGPSRQFKLEPAVETYAVENLNSEHPWGDSSFPPATTWNMPEPSRELELSQIITSEQAAPLTAMFDQTLTLGQVVETEIVTSFPHNLTIPLQMVVETEATTGFTLRATLKHGAVGTLSLLTEDIQFTPVYALTILDDELYRAPTSLTYMMSGVPVGQSVSMYFDNDTTVAWTAEANSEGRIGPLAINVPTTLLQGSHTLRAEINGAVVATAPFMLARGPVKYPGNMGQDAQPLIIPGAVSHNTRHWVFQDLLAVEEGGIGSFILPINPREMSSPHQEHGMTARHTTAITGQPHVFQTGQIPKEWTFSGYCPDEATQARMMAYRNLNRRFYIIDHHNRAWKVVITHMEFKPRLRHTFNGVETDWGSDYTVTATVLDQDPRTPT